MQLINAAHYTGRRDWDALDLMNVQDATVRLHWTSQPYVWHVNDGPEAFVVLDGKVEMHYRDADQHDAERTVVLTPGSVFLAEEGDAHVAHPMGEARVLVVEQRGSV